MIVEETIKQQLLTMFQERLKDQKPEDAMNVLATELTAIIVEAIKSGDVTILNTELTTKVSSSPTGGPVICLFPLSGSIS